MVYLLGRVFKGEGMSQGRLTAQMKFKAEAVQAIVKEMTRLEDAFRYTLQLTQKQGGRNVVAVGFKPMEIETLNSLCQHENLNLLDPPLRHHASDIHTAITPVSWGLADTGTLVLNSASEDVRLATMLADTHVALLPASKIKPDADTIEKELDEILKTEPCTYLAFITGPSRTADIERVLAIGVHGPQALHVLIMEDGAE
jgi:L-lactate dehydrogenase complex protein LldG